MRNITPNIQNMCLKSRNMRNILNERTIVVVGPTDIDVNLANVIPIKVPTTIVKSKTFQVSLK